MPVFMYADILISEAGLDQSAPSFSSRPEPAMTQLVLTNPADREFYIVEPLEISGDTGRVVESGMRGRGFESPLGIFDIFNRTINKCYISHKLSWSPVNGYIY